MPMLSGGRSYELGYRDQRQLSRLCGPTAEAQVSSLSLKLTTRDPEGGVDIQLSVLDMSLTDSFLERFQG